MYVHFYLSWCDVLYNKKRRQLSHQELPPAMSISDVVEFDVSCLEGVLNPSCQDLRRQDYSNIFQVCGPRLLLICLYFVFAFLMSVLSTNNARLRSHLSTTCHWFLSGFFLRCPLIFGEYPPFSLLSSHSHIAQRGQESAENKWQQLKINLCLCNTISFSI